MLFFNRYTQVYRERIALPGLNLIITEITVIIQSYFKRRICICKVVFTYSRPPASRCPSSCLPRLNPKSSPIMPPGFGTGHSRRFLANFSASASNRRNVDTSSSSVVDGGCGSSELSASLVHRCRRRLNLCCAAIWLLSVMSESARARRGAGHGNKCGRPTTTNEAKRVAANRDAVERERGCR